MSHQTDQDDNTPIDTNNPYPGLRPYHEDEKDNFFGRNKDCHILNDKILANRLTLLFAATGVGKSSLLKAAVMPALKDPLGANVDVVYYIDWVSEPLLTLKQSILDSLQQQGKLEREAIDNDILNVELDEFFDFCCLFSSQPLVVILDQFEEFFRYQRNKASFKPFIEQLTTVIINKNIPISLVISMREDYALELNAFKPRLPMILFENYYRLEKLTRQAAEDAILIPAQRVDFHYESALFKQLLSDLLSRELDRSQSTMVANSIETVEPPYLQIVCSQLWQRNQYDPEKTIRLQTYQQAGQAQGLLKNHIDQALQHFSLQKKQLASKAFNHLISRRGTKMAYTAVDLAETINVKPDALKRVLEKLTQLRILRSQQRQQQVWYELYHDMFSDSIETWNKAWKRRMAIRRSIMGVGALLVAGATIFLGYDFFINRYSTHLRMNLNDADSAVELYRGKADSLDLFGQTQFLAQTDFKVKDREPDKRLPIYPVSHNKELYSELIGTLPLEQRVGDFIENGQFEQAITTAYDPTPDTNIAHSQAILADLTHLYIPQAIEHILDTTRRTNNKYLLKQIEQAYSIEQLAYRLDPQKKMNTLLNGNKRLRRLIATSMGELVVTTKHIPLLKQLANDNEEQIRISAIETLGKFAEPLVFLQTLLDDTSSMIRTRAALALENLNNKKAVPALIQKLNDKDDQVRRNVSSALGSLGDKSTVPVLIEKLNDQDSEVRRSVANALGSLGDKSAVFALIAKLNDQDNEVRRSVANALGSLGDRSAVPALIEKLNDQNSAVRRSVSNALNSLSDKSTVLTLLEKLNDKDYRVRSSVAKVLGSLGDKSAVPALIEKLNDQNYYVRRNVAEALGSLGDKSAVLVLIEKLNDQSSDVQRSVSNALNSLSDKSVVLTLIEKLNDQNYYVRRSVAKALGSLGDKSAVPALIEKLNDKDYNVQSSVADALGSLGDKSAVPALIEKLNDKDDDVQRRVAVVLGSLGDKSVVPVLIEKLNDKDDQVQHSVAKALGSLGDKSAVPALIEKLNDQDNSVRSSVADALGSLGDKSAVPALIEKLNDQDNDVRRSVAKALGSLGDKSTVSALIKKLNGQYYEVQSAADALGSLGDKSAVPALIEKLNDKGYNVQSSVADALGSLGDKSAAPALIEKLNDQDYNVRRSAADALGSLGDKSAVPALIEKLNDKGYNVQSSVADALGSLGDKSAVPALIEKLNDQDNDVRSSVAKVLGSPRLSHKKIS